MNPLLVHRVDIEHSEWWDVELWCNEFVGEFDVDWYKLGIDPAAAMFGNKTTHWYFKDEQKMLLFTLRWL